MSKSGRRNKVKECGAAEKKGERERKSRDQKKAKEKKRQPKKKFVLLSLWIVFSQPNEGLEPSTSRLRACHSTN